MNIKKFSIFITVFIFAATMFSCGGDDSKWVAKIKGDEITLGELNALYYAQEKSMYGDVTNEQIDKFAANPEELAKNPTLDKKEFLENVIRQRLVYNEAIDNGLLKDKEVKALLQMAQEAVVVGYYVKEKFKDKIEVTDDEIAKIYTRQKDKFRGAPVEQAEQYIRNQLQQQKLQLKLRDLVESLKEEGGIKRNTELLEKKSEAAKKDEAVNPPAAKEEPEK